MSHNPYLTASGDPVKGSNQLKAMGRTSKGTLTASELPAVNEQGQINAHDNAQAMAIIAQLMDGRSSGKIIQARSTPESRSKSLQLLQASFSDKQNPAFAVAGETIADTVRETSARAGFLRRFLDERDLGTGEEPKIRIGRNQTTGFSLMDMSEVQESRHDGRYFYPEVVMNAAKPTVTESDLYSEGFFLLEEKAEEALEIIMVQEDRALRALSNKAVSHTNQQLAFSTFTPSVFATLKQYVQNTGGLPVNSCWMANDLWVDVNTGNSAFSDYFSPIEKHELALVGQIGRMQDTEIHTDAFLESRLRTLTRGEIYFYAQPQFLGQILVRAALMSSEIDGFDQGQQWRGWNIREYLAIGLANAAGVSRGYRV